MKSTAKKLAVCAAALCLLACAQLCLRPQQALSPALP